MASGAHRRLDAFNAVHEQRKLPYYEALGVPVTATQSEIVRAFRKLSLRLHPDKPGGCSKKFQDLNQAYRCLRDEESRRKYDACGFDEDNICTEEVDQFVDAFFGEAARNLDGRSPDWSTGSLANYVRIDLEEVPLHMKDIVRIGLHYMVSLDHDFENVVLLQHARIDILYLMVGLLGTSELTQQALDSEDSYPITYYDNPLQPGITPRWSDQNMLGGQRPKKKDLPRRELNFEEFQRRQKHALAMLENAPADPMAALEEKYRARMLAQQEEYARVADERRCEALRDVAVDVYEDDAELDCGAFAASIAARDGVSAGDGDGDTRLAPAPDAEAGSAAGLQEVPWMRHDDGLLFVAKDGNVLLSQHAPPQATAA